jgi:hypothetical protein
MSTRCMVPDTLRGVKMSHSDDAVTVWHGASRTNTVTGEVTALPALACGFCATYSSDELYRAHAEILKCGPCWTEDVCPDHGDLARLSVETAHYARVLARKASA